MKKSATIQKKIDIYFDLLQESISKTNHIMNSREKYYEVFGLHGQKEEDIKYQISVSEKIKERVIVLMNELKF